MPQKITAHYRIVTPMFIGDANQAATAISPQSVKGALRFWWRALQWGTFLKAHPNDEAAALCALHQKEGQLFGSQAEDGGQGAFLLRVKHGNLTSTDEDKVHEKFKPSRPHPNGQRNRVDENHLAGARYLGYGLITAFTSRDRETNEIIRHSGQLERSCLNENQEFTVELLFKGNIDTSVQNALIGLGLFGGLGSRSRHGLGSIVLQSIKDVTDKKESKELWKAPATKEKYHEEIQNLFPNILPPAKMRPLPTTEPPFSAFWKDSRIDHLLTASDCYRILDDFGAAMLMYRSSGRNWTVLGQPSEKRFKDDHDWFRERTFATVHPNFHPERVMFGLPHNYGQHTHHITSEHHERRSSPLLFHVHSVGNQFFGMSIYLPAKFLPNGERIKANGELVPQKTNNWTVITNFLDGKVGNPPAATAPARFPSKQAVLP